MPELPEVENVCRGLIPVLKGRMLTDIKQYRENLRYSLPIFFTERLQGRVIENIERRAKYILIHFKDDSNLLVAHLGMSGSFRIETDNFQLKKHDHIVFKTDQGKSISYNDPRRFGFMDIISKENWLSHSFFKQLGPEPFDENFTALHFYEKLKNKKQAIKQVILDQQFIVGVGNIYASESLWQSRIHPLKAGQDLSQLECEKLLMSIREVLEKAIKAGGSTLNDYHRPDGELGCFQHQFKVYAREGLNCLGNCSNYIKKQMLGGRSTFFCELCQV